MLCIVFPECVQKAKNWKFCVKKNYYKDQKQHHLKLLEKAKRDNKKTRFFRSECLNESPFLKEYKSDKARVTCMACNNQFSVHYSGKSDVLHHSKSEQHLKNIRTFNLDDQY